MEALYKAVTEEEDKIGWDWEKGKDYSVKSYYAVQAKGKNRYGASTSGEREVNYPLKESGTHLYPVG